MNPYFSSTSSTDLFRDTFVEHFKDLIDRHMSKAIVDRIFHKAMGFANEQAFLDFMKSQPERDEHTPMFDSLVAFESFCRDVSQGFTSASSRGPIHANRIQHFMARYMGYMSVSDCLVDLLRMENASDEKQEDNSLYHSVAHFREESQKLSGQLKSIKLSALRLAMAKAQGFTDTRAYEKHLDTLSGETAPTTEADIDPNTYMIRRSGYLFIQGPKPLAAQKNHKDMQCWDDMAQRLQARLNDGESVVEDVSVSGNPYVVAKLKLSNIEKADKHLLSKVISNFYYTSRDEWVAGPVVERYMNTLVYRAVDFGAEEYQDFEDRLSSLWDGESPFDLGFFDEESIVDTLAVRDSVSQARAMFGDRRIEDVKRAVRWRLPVDVNERTEEYNALEVITGNTLINMDWAMINTLKNQYKGAVPPKGLELALRVVNMKADIRQAMLMTFVLGQVPEA